MQSLNLTLEGNVPPKKNSRIHTKSGLSFPSKAFTEWQDDAIKQVRIQTKARFYNPVSVEVVIYFGKLARADVDNRLTSILDMLVEAFVLKDDDWQSVPRVVATGEYRKGQPGAIVTITEIKDVLTQL